MTALGFLNEVMNGAKALDGKPRDLDKEPLGIMSENRALLRLFFFQSRAGPNRPVQILQAV